MKAIGIKMVDLQPMRANMALQTGYKIGNAHPDDMGYEVTYPDGYKSWSPKDVADAAYFILDENNDGSKILKEDVESFITDVETMKIGEKTTVVNAHTLTGFDTVRHSSCVSPENYSDELGKKYAMETVISDIRGHLGFVLQWAKHGLNKVTKSEIPTHVQRIINEYNELDKRLNKLTKFISESSTYQYLPEDEKEDMKEQLNFMTRYINVLSSRLRRVGIETSKL